MTISVAPVHPVRIIMNIMKDETFKDELEYYFVVNYLLIIIQFIISCVIT